jgi:hypothetical protein
MDAIESYIEEKVNFGVQDRNREYLDFPANGFDLETVNLNIHMSNLGDHHITNPPNNNDPGNANLFVYAENNSDNNSVSEIGEENGLDNYIQSEEESDLEKYKEDMNNQSNKRLKEDFSDYYNYLGHMI